MSVPCCPFPSCLRLTGKWMSLRNSSLFFVPAPPLTQDLPQLLGGERFWPFSLFTAVQVMRVLAARWCFQACPKGLSELGWHKTECIAHRFTAEETPDSFSPTIACMIPSSTVKSSQERCSFQVGISSISSCSVIQACDIFGKRLLLSSSGGPPRT